MAVERHIFLTRRAEEVTRWREAFPNAEVVSYTDAGTILVERPGIALVWLHLTRDVTTSTAEKVEQERRKSDSPAELVRLAIRIAPGCAVIALSNVANQEEGLLCLEAGASGYTSALANPEVLRQIATVVEHGGLWVGPELMTRFRSSLATLTPGQLHNLDERLSPLSPREREVAIAVAAGATNKEVARSMGITERTVKAHLTAAFERLGVRDRMQLSLLVNGS